MSNLKISIDRDSGKRRNRLKIRRKPIIQFKKWGREL